MTFDYCRFVISWYLSSWITYFIIYIRKKELSQTYFYSNKPKTFVMRKKFSDFYHGCWSIMISIRISLWPNSFPLWRILPPSRLDPTSIPAEIHFHRGNRVWLRNPPGRKGNAHPDLFFPADISTLARSFETHMHIYIYTRRIHARPRRGDTSSRVLPAFLKPNSHSSLYSLWGARRERCARCPRLLLGEERPCGRTI